MRPERLAALLFALARTAFCGYRAFTQSVTVDEATTFLNYVRGPWASIYSQYDPNNHVLYSIFAKLAVRAFRLSEFSLRVPSVLAGFFLMAGIYWVLEATVCSRWIRWIALVGLGLHPLLLDLTTAARGYGLSLALLVWATYFAIKEREVVAGILLGLAISANLTIVFPAVGLIACPLMLRKNLRGTLEIAIPAALFAGAICYPALTTARSTQFYVGDPSLRYSILEMVFMSIRARDDVAGLFGTLRGTRVIQYFFLPAVVIFMMLVTRRALIPAIVLVACGVELIGAHYLLGMNYPVDRVGIYLIPLFGLAWAIAASEAARRPLRIASGTLGCILILQFGTQIQTRYFQLWEFDMPMRQVASLLRDECRGKAAATISLSATWYHVPALEFYRYYYRIGALKPVERHAKTLLEGFDYYVLNLKDDDDVRTGDTARLTLLYTEPHSGVLVAKEPRGP